MLNTDYVLDFAELHDLSGWMKLIEIVKDNFPGLETNVKLEGYKQTVIKNINRHSAICCRHFEEIVGVMIFSYNQKCLSCMAVHPNHRRNGIASAMVEKMISLLPNDVDIWVTTFREDDGKGVAPRPLYKKYGFVEGELLYEFDYPLQKFILHR